ncbi:MAG: glycine betaine ABC transporter substrate-binding protein [Nocardioidaceae bacterium]
MSIRRTAALIAAIGTIFTGVAACSSSNGGGSASCSISPTSSKSSSSGRITGNASGQQRQPVMVGSAGAVQQAADVVPEAASKGTITLAAQAYTEMEIMAEMYKQVLQKAGYTVNVKLVQTRDIYMPLLENGSVQVVPEYVSGIGDFLNTAANGANAKSLMSNNAQASLAALKPLADKAGITMLNPAKATDQNAFAVTKACADKYNLSTLSDLAALKAPIVLAAAPDCKGRSDCAGGLSQTYGLKITKILSLGFDTTEGKNSATSGESQVVEVATTDGALSSENLVLLKDDKGIQPAQNLIPAVNTSFLKSHPDVAPALNKLSATLTTADLAALNIKVDVNRDKASTVATDYLNSKGLL